jgi:heme-degrading monooxygenase HmoA
VTARKPGRGTRVGESAGESAEAPASAAAAQVVETLPGVLRVSTGEVRRGAEREFVSLVAARISRALSETPALRGFAGGYRRVEGRDQFALITYWASAESLGRILGERPEDAASIATLLGTAATAERIEHYEVLPPAGGGIVDFSGGVIRLSRTTIRPERLAAGYERIHRSADELARERMLIAQYIGRRMADGRHRVVTASVWPSLAAVEAFVGPRPTEELIFPEMAAYLDEVSIEHYHTIEFGFGAASYEPPRRAFAVRFADRATADGAIERLRDSFRLGEKDAVVAPLGRTEPGSGTGDEVVVVIRIRPGDRFEAERMIADLGGAFLTSLA